jgi:hypothetical protein
MKAMFSVYSIGMTTFSASFVNVYSRRSYWRKNAPTLNAKCNPATPFPTDLKEPKVLFDDGWSSRVSLRQPAGTKPRAVCRQMVLL